MTAEERNWGALAHAIPLGLNLITGLGWVASLIIYFAYKDKSRFVAHHAAQSLAMAALFFLLAIGGTIASAGDRGHHCLHLPHRHPLGHRHVDRRGGGGPDFAHRGGHQGEQRRGIRGAVDRPGHQKPDQYVRPLDISMNIEIS